MSVFLQEHSVSVTLRGLRMNCAPADDLGAVGSACHFWRFRRGCGMRSYLDESKGELLGCRDIKLSHIYIHVHAHTPYLRRQWSWKEQMGGHHGEQGVSGWRDSWDKGRFELGKKGLLRERLPEVGGRNEASVEAGGRRARPRTRGRGDILAKCMSKGETGRDLSRATSCVVREMD